MCHTVNKMGDSVVIKYSISNKLPMYYTVFRKSDKCDKHCLTLSLHLKKSAFGLLFFKDFIRCFTHCELVEKLWYLVWLGLLYKTLVSDKAHSKAPGHSSSPESSPFKDGYIISNGLHWHSYCGYNTGPCFTTASHYR